MNQIILVIRCEVLELEILEGKSLMAEKRDYSDEIYEVIEERWIKEVL